MNVRTTLWIVILAAGLPILTEAAPMYFEQVACRWRNDDGGEAVATWKAAANTPISGVKRDENIRLRFAVWNANLQGADDDRLFGRVEYAASTNGPWTPVGLNPGRAFQMVSTSWYTNGQPTTAQLPLSGATFLPGQCVEDPENIGMAQVGFNKNKYSNLEYCFRATAYAKRNTTYYFRVTQTVKCHPKDTFDYLQYATLTMADTDVVPPDNLYVDDDDANTVRSGASLNFLIEGASGHLNPWEIQGWDRMIMTPDISCANTVGAWQGGSRFNAAVATDTNHVAFRWIPDVRVAAQYNVYARWTYDEHRGRNIPYTIGHASGTSTQIFVNQRNPALSGKWNLLGTYTFNAGTNGWVEMSGNDGVACADAVWLEKVGSGGGNQSPTANAQSVATDEDTAKAITLVGSDPEGSALSYSIVANPAHGTLTGTGASRTYTPVANYNGTDSFTFKVSDGALDSAAATVSITVTAVNDAPTCTLTAPANGATYTAPASVAIQATAADVDGTIAKVAFFNGATKLGEDTTSPYAYTWSGVAAGTYTLTLKATDNNSVTTTSASVSITVTSAANQPPIANAQSVSTAEDTAKAITLTGNDPENAPLTYILAANPTHGTLAGTGASRTYTPAANYNGTDSFTFKVNDGALTSTPATVSITVNAVNDAPTVTASGTPTSGIAPLTVNFTASGADVDGDTLGYSWNFGNGSAATTAQNPSHVYTSNGTYTASVTVSGGKGGSASATVSITVNPAVSGSETVIFMIDPDAAYDIGAGQGVATVMIKDTTDLTTPTVAVVATDANAAESAATVNSGTFTLNRTSRFHEDLVINYAIRGTASNGVDYSTLSGTLIIPKGVASKTLVITPKADAVADSNETVIVAIQANAAYLIKSGQGTATVTIADTTVLTTPTVSLAVLDATAVAPAPGVAVDTGLLLFKRTSRFQEPLVVNYTLGGTAVNGVDYTLLSGTATISAGAASTVLRITPTVNATKIKKNVLLTLGTSGGYNIDGANGAGIVTIVE